MKITEKAKTARVLPTNRAMVKNCADKKFKDTPYYHLCLLIAEGMDEIGRDVNFYCTFGSTKKGDALTLSINLDGDRQILYAVDLGELAVQSAELHDAP